MYVSFDKHSSHLYDTAKGREKHEKKRREITRQGRGAKDTNGEMTRSKRH